jgi:hypothetical protein
MPGLLDLYRKAADLAEFKAPPKAGAFERIGIYPAGGSYFFDEHSGTWRVVYERGNLPTPGAMVYAYMSNAQGPVDKNGRGTEVLHYWRAYQPPQAYAPQAIGLRSIPGVIAGQVITQPLSVPNSAVAQTGV